MNDAPERPGAAAAAARKALQPNVNNVAQVSVPAGVSRKLRRYNLPAL
jgi:hypothetical protein